MKIKYFITFLIISLLPVQLTARPQEWISSYFSENRAIVSIQLGESLSYVEEYESPPQIILTFATTQFELEHFSKQMNMAPLYRIEAYERFTTSGANETIVVLNFNKLPDYSIESEGDNKVIISWESMPPVKTEADPEPEATLQSAFSLNKTGSLNFRGAPLLDVLRLLAEQNNLNIIAGEELDGDITVKLNDVNLADALDAILKVNGYSWFIQGNIVVIKPTADEMAGELTTRVYQLNYIDAISLASALSNVLSSKGKTQVFSPIPQGGLGIMGGGNSGITQYTGGNSNTGNNAFSGQSGGSSSMGGNSQNSGMNGSNQMNNQASVDHIIITDIYANFVSIEQVIKELDQRVAQINIAVKFIETKLSIDERMGIDWSMRAQLNSPVETESGKTNAGFDQILELGDFSNLKIATLSLPLFSGMIELLSSDDDTRLIQEPQTTTLNNTTASITVGTTFPILVPQENNSLITEQLYSFEEEEITISLNVTPRINEDQYISMRMNALVEALVGMTGPNDDRPIVSQRSTNTHVMVRDGETLLIGGLIFDQMIENKTKVPILGDIPLLKHLFTHQSNLTEQRELLIFITPSIVNMD